MPEPHGNDRLRAAAIMDRAEKSVEGMTDNISAMICGNLKCKPCDCWVESVELSPDEDQEITDAELAAMTDHRAADDALRAVEEGRLRA